jgi:hypothetical protein
MASESTTTVDTTEREQEEAQAPEQEHASTTEQSPEPSPEEKTTEDAGPTDPESTGGFVAGAAAVVAAGLGLVSLTGTSLSDMLRAHEQVVGQIKSATGEGGDQIDALYGAPWHLAAVVNGLFALVAVLVGGGLLAAGGRADTRPWTKAVALGGVLLGVLGLLVATGMYLDLFASQPAVPGGVG